MADVPVITGTHRVNDEIELAFSQGAIWFEEWMWVEVFCNRGAKSYIRLMEPWLTDAEFLEEGFFCGSASIGCDDHIVTRILDCDDPEDVAAVVAAIEAGVLEEDFDG